MEVVLILKIDDPCRNLIFLLNTVYSHLHNDTFQFFFLGRQESRTRALLGFDHHQNYIGDLRVCTYI